MNAAAQVTTDDGDKVNHGWSQLDIAKHSTNTFVSSLEDGDFVSIITYSDGANASLCLPPPLPPSRPPARLRTPCHQPPQSLLPLSQRGGVARLVPMSSPPHPS